MALSGAPEERVVCHPMTAIVIAMPMPPTLSCIETRDPDGSRALELSG
ncbi:MAG: hypothetical protein OXT09_17965 [Myxococcales bacterium]|nr:hypothetical protein [Myxococcales bacterium]